MNDTHEHKPSIKEQIAAIERARLDRIKELVESREIENDRHDSKMAEIAQELKDLGHKKPRTRKAQGAGQ